jgi:hypothetical protein
MNNKPQDPVTLYPPHGVDSQPRRIPRIDMDGWLNAGWSLEPVEVVEEPLPETPPTPESELPPPIEQKPAPQPKATKAQPKAVETETPVQE